MVCKQVNFKSIVHLSKHLLIKDGLLVLVLGVDDLHRKESGYPLRDFASRPDRAYKLEIQMIAWLREILRPVLS